MIRSEFQWIVDLPIPCPKCDKETPETVARLVTRDTLPCRCCGQDIDGNQRWDDREELLQLSESDQLRLFDSLDKLVARAEHDVKEMGGDG